MTTVHDRIRERLAALRKSYRAASLDSGMSPEAISTLLRNTSMSPTLATIEKLALGLKTTPEWLAFGVNSNPGVETENEGSATCSCEDEITGEGARKEPSISRRHDMRSIQATVGALHRLVSGALQNESISEAEADAYADVVLELLEEQTTESVVLRLREELRSAPEFPRLTSDD